MFKFRNKKYNIDVTSDKLKIAKGYIKEDDLTKYELEVILFFLNNLFKNIKVPTIKDWEELKNNIREHGLYHSYRQAIAP